MSETVISVKQLNLYVRSLIEGDVRLAHISVVGEISNFKNHYSSGHWYFSLKDNDATIKCVMFRANASRVKFDVADGLQVVLKGRVSIYEKDGQYQFYAEDMTAYGVGDIALKFEQTKEKLSKEGLFDAETKRAIPKFPKKIAVVTSPTGAAVRDIFNILSRRWPIAEIVMCPVSVQGELAVPEMLNALDRIYKLSGIDIIIIGRGGGSREDLWAFNDETLARKIYESPFPVISAVGHETDFSISDFVADLRAPTPSAAAELAVPDITELLEKLNKYKNVLKNYLNAKYDLSLAKFEAAVANPYFKNANEIIVDKRAEHLDKLCDKLRENVKKHYSDCESIFLKNVALLDSLSPLKTLSRGFVSAKLNGNFIKSANDFSVGDLINLRFADGEADCEVKTKRGV